MNYIEFDIPEEFKDQDIRQFEPKKAKVFYRWFLSIKDERVKMLEYTVQHTPGFENWKADFSPQSLNHLQKWFELQIRERAITDEEQEARIKAFEGTKFEEHIKQSNRPVWTLTGKTIRLAVDCGIYFSEVFMHNNPTLYWGQNTRSKLYIDKNYPLILGFAGEEFSPFFIVKRNMVNLYKRGEKFTWEEKYKRLLQYIKSKN